MKNGDKQRTGNEVTDSTRIQGTVRVSSLFFFFLIFPFPVLVARSPFPVLVTFGREQQNCSEFKRKDKMRSQGGLMCTQYS